MRLNRLELRLKKSEKKGNSGSERIQFFLQNEFEKEI